MIVGKVHDWVLVFGAIGFVLDILLIAPANVLLVGPGLFVVQNQAFVGPIMLVEKYAFERAELFWLAIGTPKITLGEKDMLLVYALVFPIDDAQEYWSEVVVPYDLDKTMKLRSTVTFPEFVPFSLAIIALMATSLSSGSPRL